MQVVPFLMTRIRVMQWSLPTRCKISTNLCNQIIVRIFANNIYVRMAKQELTTEQEQLARFAKALGHPVRIAILQMLAQQTCCYHGDMSEILPVAKSTLSQHLKELKEAGLIQGTITLPTVKYCINRENWETAKTMFKELFDNIQDRD